MPGLWSSNVCRTWGCKAELSVWKLQAIRAYPAITYDSTQINTSPKRRNRTLLPKSWPARINDSPSNAQAQQPRFKRTQHTSDIPPACIRVAIPTVISPGSPVLCSTDDYDCQDTNHKLPAAWPTPEYERPTASTSDEAIVACGCRSDWPGRVMTPKRAAGGARGWRPADRRPVAERQSHPRRPRRPGSLLDGPCPKPAPDRSDYATTAPTCSRTTRSGRIRKPEDTWLQTTDPDKNGFVGRLSRQHRFANPGSDALAICLIQERRRSSVGRFG